jgi:DNA topoisomerase-3
MPDDAERKGLGTPATRAAIIETLVKSEFLTRKDKNLLPTDKGVNLIKILPKSVKSPMLTAEWENHLKRIEKGQLSVDDFMVSINRFIGDIVKTHTAPSDEHKALFPSNRQSDEVIGICPRCGNNVTERQKGFFCENKACKFGLFRDNKFFTVKKKTLTKEIAKTLLTEGRIFMSGLTGGLESKLLKAWHVDLLREVKPKRMYFAYDTPDDYEPLLQAGRLLREEPETKMMEKLDPDTGAPLLDENGKIIMEEMTALPNMRTYPY